MASWRDRWNRPDPSSTPPTSPEPASPSHARARAFIDRFADAGLGRVFGGMPGAEHVARYLKGRASRELGKLDEDTLQRYLAGLEALMRAVRTGEEFETVLAMSLEAVITPEEAA